MEFPEESLSRSGKGKSSKILCSKAGSRKPRKRKGEIGDSDLHSLSLLKQTAQRDQEEPWVDRYSPRSQVSIISVDFFFFTVCKFVFTCLNLNIYSLNFQTVSLFCVRSIFFKSHQGNYC